MDIEPVQSVPRPALNDAALNAPWARPTVRASASLPSRTAFAHDTAAPPAPRETMGVIRWLDRIDPSVWDRASERVQALGTDLLERRAAIAFLEEFGRTPSKDSVVSTLGDDDDPDPGLLNGLFEEAVTEESWELDKSLEELKGVARLLPGGSAFLKIIDFKGIDVEPPQICHPTEYGLFGCCSSGNLADCASVAQRFAAPPDVVAALREWSPGFVGQLLGRGLLATKATKTIGNDYYSGHWQTLCRAVLVTTSRGHHLGLGMSG